MKLTNEEHYCLDVKNFPLDKFFQKGIKKGQKILIVGESPAENGWRKSGKAFYTPEGKLLASGKRLNELLINFDLNVSKCGFTELSKCFIGKNRKILSDCCKKCWPIFEKQLENNKCKLIITLGIIPAKIIGDLLKKQIEVGKMTEINVGKKLRKLLPIYHPSPVNPFGKEKNKKIFDQYKEEIKNIIFD